MVLTMENFTVDKQLVTVSWKFWVEGEETRRGVSNCPPLDGSGSTIVPKTAGQQGSMLRPFDEKNLVDNPGVTSQIFDVHESPLALTAKLSKLSSKRPPPTCQLKFKGRLNGTPSTVNRSLDGVIPDEKGHVL